MMWLTYLQLIQQKQKQNKAETSISQVGIKQMCQMLTIREPSEGHMDIP